MPTVKWISEEGEPPILTMTQSLAGVRMKYLGLAVLLIALTDGCAVRYKAGDSCWSFEMVSTDDWCERQRVIEHASRIKSEALLLEQIRQFNKQEATP
ncbi:MAG: hypothetical protein ACYCZR_01055 [Burkholderiales bacterium]